MADAQKIGRFGFGVILAALALAPNIGGFVARTAPNSLFPYLPEVALSALRVLVLFGAGCLASSYRAPASAATGGGTISRRIAKAALIAAGTLAALTVLSLLVHSRLLTRPVLLFVQLPATLDWLSYTTVFAVGIGAGRGSKRGGVWLVGAVLIGLTIAALIAVRQYGQAVQAGDREERISGLFFDPNFLAGFLALGLPLAIAACLAVRDRLGAFALGVLAAITAGALASTGSRAGCGIGFLAAVVTIGSAAYSAKGSVRVARLAVLAAAAAALIFFLRGPLTARGAQEHSGSFRQYTWRGTIAMAKANPLLGAGPGTYPDRYPPFAIVEKTGLAHSSYLQLAAEQGLPALAAALVAVLAALAGAANGIFALRRTGDPEPEPLSWRLLYCGVLGAVIAGAARSLFDSEWSLSGNALPFWALAGLAASGGVLTQDARAVVRESAGLARGRAVAAISAFGLAAIALLVLRNAAYHDTIELALGQGPPPQDASQWPPDPDLLYWTGHPDAAATIEPSGSRFFKAGRDAEQRSDFETAAADMRRAAELDPNSLQIWRALAETEEKAQDHPAALAAWRELIRRYEGPAGQIRAIPELPETFPAFAYAAVGDAEPRSDSGAANARKDYENALRVIDLYSNTSPLYQRVELAQAQLGHIDVAARRREIKDLYDRVLHSLAALPGASAADQARLQQREMKTFGRLDAFPAN